MCNAEAIAILDTAVDFLFTAKAKRKCESVRNLGNLIFLLAQETDAFILEAESRLGSKKALAELVENTDKEIVAAAFMRWFNLKMLLIVPKAGAPCQFTMITEEHPLSSTLILAWRECVKPSLFHS